MIWRPFVQTCPYTQCIRVLTGLFRVLQWERRSFSMGLSCELPIALIGASNIFTVRSNSVGGKIGREEKGSILLFRSIRTNSPCGRVLS